MPRRCRQRLHAPLAPSSHSGYAECSRKNSWRGFSRSRSIFALVPRKVDRRRTFTLRLFARLRVNNLRRLVGARTSVIPQVFSTRFAVAQVHPSCNRDDRPFLQFQNDRTTRNPFPANTEYLPLGHLPTDVGDRVEDENNFRVHRQPLHTLHTGRPRLCHMR